MSFDEEQASDQIYSALVFPCRASSFDTIILQDTLAHNIGLIRSLLLPWFTRSNSSRLLELWPSFSKV
ncbi:hypothetical protein M422DRAFT_262163 [Sphaerobolus stellatus SS14]|uniref:Uncharacterized protein n=1 Tax=Sphaerobolus stellatus (strain SS14) TaxID=990650 RepID=A0A0C9VDS9_SPHS4|nr:hypothetical protein M422DRAFT_262163 [Sphaerobolus stellatus SS14]